MPKIESAAQNVRWDLSSIYSGIDDPQIDLDIAEFTRQAEAFHATLEIDGVILSKLDGDARGGAALSVKEVPGRPSPSMPAIRESSPRRSATRSPTTRSWRCSAQRSWSISFSSKAWT